MWYMWAVTSMTSLSKETLAKQYEVVIHYPLILRVNHFQVYKLLRNLNNTLWFLLLLQVRRRTANGYIDSSHVMQIGNKRQSEDFLFTYMGTNPENDNYTNLEYTSSPSTSRPRVVSQRNADLLHFWYKVIGYIKLNSI